MVQLLVGPPQLVGDLGAGRGCRASAKAADVAEAQALPVGALIKDLQRGDLVAVVFDELLEGLHSVEGLALGVACADELLRVVVTYTDGTGSGRSATGAPTERADQGATVTLSTRVPDVGIAVTATQADADGNVTGAVWQWQSSVSTGTPSWSDISDADEASYTPLADDEGKFIPVTQ